MAWTRARWLAMLLPVCAAACSSPTEPVPPGYTGEWVGTTSHGTTVSFSVVDNDVTSFTVRFNAPPTCSGSETLTGPRQILTDSKNVSGFVINNASVIEPPKYGVAAAGQFSADRRSALGEVKTVQHPTCGAITISWNARRQ